MWHWNWVEAEKVLRCMLEKAKISVKGLLKEILARAQKGKTRV